MRIETGRLILRPMTLEDVDDLFEVFSDPRAMQYWSTRPFTQRAQMQAHIQESLDAPSAQTVEFAVEFEGRAIGKAGFWRLPEIGYILHPDYWRRGFAQEALGGLIDLAFQRLGLSHICADVDPDNLASIALLEKLGFAESGRAQNTIEIEGVWYDSIYFRLEAPR